MKKLSVILLMLAMMLTFTACGTTEEDIPSDTSVSDTSSTDTSSADTSSTDTSAEDEPWYENHSPKAIPSDEEPWYENHSPKATPSEDEAWHENHSPKAILSEDEAVAAAKAACPEQFEEYSVVTTTMESDHYHIYVETIYDEDHSNEFACDVNFYTGEVYNMAG